MVATSIFGMGPNTFWIFIHHVASIALVLSIADYVFGSVYFSSENSTHAVRHMRIGSIAALVSSIVVVVSGIVPDIAFGSPSAFNLTTTTAYGTQTLHTSVWGLGAFAGPLLFDIMEHISLIVPGLIAMIAVLCWSLGRDVLAVPHYKRAVLSITVLAFFWIAVIAVIGVYLVKFLTFPVGS